MSDYHKLIIHLSDDDDTKHQQQQQQRIEQSKWRYNNTIHKINYKTHNDKFIIFLQILLLSFGSFHVYPDRNNNYNTHVYSFISLLLIVFIILLYLFSSVILFGLD